MVGGGPGRLRTVARLRPHDASCLAVRREEVAARVAISYDYYTRVEHGRLGRSEPVLQAIAQVLCVTGTT
ncbi:hypothetical protein TUM20983_40510 [Mycobacterium antarcticum]|uniref:helix-turn-helix domain-containing protein n=1 Tax=unclassified Mycolicibacterium TaxID=2636767 RepID=UPI002393F3F5|nr:MULTISPECIES: helix-turn-helix transcriptional regulator [unclassified Mycolicibacterium]GLP76941.1 hypothetical protein TUM20983_40510 [Mycolicibacterium sp. TUM20983]GLP82638.1 hypothetical protein TUM20984_40580 [Mycolicibacterium sp. TUM20984]